MSFNWIVCRIFRTHRRYSLTYAIVCCRHGEVKEELEEYEISSRELEAELEAQLEQQENKNRELLSANQRLQMELDSARVSVRGEEHPIASHLTGC